MKKTIIQIVLCMLLIMNLCGCGAVAVSEDPAIKKPAATETDEAQENNASEEAETETAEASGEAAEEAEIPDEEETATASKHTEAAEAGEAETNTDVPTNAGSGTCFPGWKQSSGESDPAGSEQADA